MNIKLLFTGILFLCIVLVAEAQVTIGSTIPPNAGALLDLKEETPSTAGGATASKGLALPRVKLVSATIPTGGNLAQTILDTDPSDVWDKDEHIGLTVYHPDICTMQGNGLYVWSGLEWQKIGKPNLRELNFSQESLEFINGQSSPQTVSVNWNSSITPTFTYTATDFNSITPTELSGTTPQSLSIAPSPLPQATIASRPFTSVIKTIVFEYGCENLQKTLNIQQVNKALLVNGSTTPATIAYSTNSGNVSAAIRSNAKWKLTVTPTTNSAVSFLNPTEGTIQGSERNDGDSNANSQFYRVTSGIGLQRYNYLTFSDTEDPKRFDDVVLSLTQCSGTDFTMSQWKDIWEERYGLIDGVDEPDNDGDVSKNPNKVQWHMDHEGNIFFSSMFGNVRYMVTNLATKSYGPRTGGTSWTPSTLENTYTAAGYTWAYPRGAVATTADDATVYNNRQSLGLFYSWSAATGGVMTRPVQGICPEGWHIPDDQLLGISAEIRNNPSKYTVNGRFSDGFGLLAMENCPPVGVSDYPGGKSKPFIEGGLDLSSLGFLYNGVGTRQGIGSNNLWAIYSTGSNMPQHTIIRYNITTGVNTSGSVNPSLYQVAVRCAKL